MSSVEWLIEPYFAILPFDLATVLAGIVWGQKSLLQSSTIDVFKQTGLLHLLVLSGQNITLLLSFFSFIPRLFGYRIQLCVIVLIGLFYICTFPNDPSVIRASIMAIISSGVIFFEYQTLSIYIFFLTCAIMLGFKPEWFQSLSFWLSCSATAGILIVYPWLRHKNYLLNQVGLFFSAQLFTAPLILIWFREYPTLSVFTNLSVMWIIEPIMFMGIVLSIVGHCGEPFLLLTGSITQGLLHIFLALVYFGYRISSLFILRI